MLRRTKTVRKLTIRRDVIRALSGTELTRAVGGVDLVMDDTHAEACTTLHPQAKPNS